jgi:ribosomal protein S18 acetylase RimI-like enzyme
MRVQIVERLTQTELERVCRILHACGLRRRTPAMMRRALSQTMAIAIAVDQGVIIGFGRMLGDSTLYASLWDIAVTPERQADGIGSAIVERLMRIARRRKLRIVGLFTAMKNRRFYERLGFQMLDNIHPMTAQLRQEKITDGKKARARRR